MNIKYFGGLAAIGIVVAMALSVNFSAKDNESSDVFLANIIL